MTPESNNIILTNIGQEDLMEVFSRLSEVGRNFYRRGWVLGTSGNFSAVIERRPLRLAITPSGIDKGNIQPDRILQVDQNAQVVYGSGKPSDETRLHLSIVLERNAGAVLHTHSVWSTILSNYFAGHGGINIEGYEMLKGLSGIHSHEHKEWIPIIDNSQDMISLAEEFRVLLQSHTEIHGILIRGHGLYTWGETLQEAARHIEILEFLLEVHGRTHFAEN